MHGFVRTFRKWQSTFKARQTTVTISVAVGHLGVPGSVLALFQVSGDTIYLVG